VGGFGGCPNKKNENNNEAFSSACSCGFSSACTYLCFVIYPLIKVFYLSFFEWRGVAAGTETFVGIKNFARLIHDPVFWRALTNNLLLFAFVVLVSLILALFFSYFLERQFGCSSTILH